MSQIDHVGLRDRVMIEIDRPAERARLEAAQRVEGAGGVAELDHHPEQDHDGAPLPSPLDSLQMPVHDGTFTYAPELTKPDKSEMFESVMRDVLVSYNKDPQTRSVLVAIPSLGKVSTDFMLSMMHMSRPVNWRAITYCPKKFDVAEARNDCVALALREKQDWCLFIDHDVLPPRDALLRMCRHMMRGDRPVVSGLYYTKSTFSEPLIFRGRLNGPYYDWKHGDEFWVDGIPMGFALIHTSVFRAMRPPFFVTPRMAVDKITGMVAGKGLYEGTEDLPWCSRVIDENTLQRAGWKMPDPQHPFWMDTGIFCQHQDQDDAKFPECVWDRAVADHEAARAAIADEKAREAASAKQDRELAA